VNGTIVVAGAIARQTGRAGHAWQYLQYLLGFRRLGYDVLFIDSLEQPVDAAGVAYLRRVMEDLELGDCWSLLYDGTAAGVSRREAVRRARSALLLVNVMGYLQDEEILGAAPKRVFLDIDPGFGQMWRELGLADIFAGHDAYVTIGVNVGRTDCAIPPCGLDWITTSQPVVLEQWPASNGSDSGRFTSVGAWRGPFGPVEYDGEVWGQRVHEFRKFADLPRRTRAQFELAFAIDPGDERDRELLDEKGWSLVDPIEVAASPGTYRRYIQGSKAEFMVAKNMYVKSVSGWFSDRSICYLASGKPVLAQDTGLRHLYPVGEGLLTFSTLDEAAAGVEEIEGNYGRHSAAARALAVDYFDSDKVLGRLLDRLA
jgi:hypothetical protein